MKSLLLIPILSWIIPIANAADAPPGPMDAGKTQPAAAATDLNRYGPLGLFDARSSYGKGVFPEPFLVDDSDLEHNELRLDWFHLEARGQVGNQIRAEFEKGIELATIEFEATYESDRAETLDPLSGRPFARQTDSFDNLSLGIRQPVFQFVSTDELFDTTVGVAIEAGVPLNAPLSKNAEVVPKLFTDLIVGQRFTLQCVLGYSFVLGSSDGGGGNQTLEYGLVFGYSIPHDQLPLPDVEQLIPVVELHGDTLVNSHQAGQDTLIGDVALRANLKVVGEVQPRLGVGYVFPIDHGGRETVRWGVITSLVFDF